jgi:glycosyltransferase involved in cell wall biosynthesis
LKVLLISQYFYPENFKINDLIFSLKERGHQITVLTGKPNYSKINFFEGYGWKSDDFEIVNEIPVYRANLFSRRNGGALRLFLNYFSFALLATLKLRKIKGPFDAIFVYEPSPITVGIPAIFAKKKFNAPIYFWAQDLWPESLVAAGGVKNKFILGFFNSLTKWIYNHSKKVLIQSDGFREYILNQGIPNDKILFYPNPTEVIVLGDGRYKETALSLIKEKGLDAHFNFLGSFPPTEMPKFFSHADALLVSLKKDKIFSLTIPAKIQSYLACGKPIIASIDGEGAKIVNDAKCGVISPAEDSIALSNIIKELMVLDKSSLNEMGNNGRAYYEKEFDRAYLLDKLENILIS